MWSMTAALITEKDKCGDNYTVEVRQKKNGVQGQSSDLRPETTLAPHRHMQPNLYQHK